MLNHAGTQKIETSRLILRKHELSDAQDMYNNWMTDSEVSKFWSWQPHKSIEETKALLAGFIKASAKLEIYNWIIELKSISQAVGYIYLSDIDNENGSASVHYALSRKHWNQGIMPEACAAVIEFAFSVLHAQKLHTHHHVDNPASSRVMEKCDMRYLKTAHKDMPGCPRISGDYCHYEILLAAWERIN